MDLSTVDDDLIGTRQFLLCCFHCFLMPEAADLLPKMRREVCLSAPVVFETGEDSAKTICTVN